MGISVFSVNGFDSLEIVQGFINARSQVRHPTNFKHLHRYIDEFTFRWNDGV
jgi:hypothetical protein